MQLVGVEAEQAFLAVIAEAEAIVSLAGSAFQANVVLLAGGGVEDGGLGVPVGIAEEAVGNQLLAGHG